MFSFYFFRELLPHEVSLSLLSPTSDHCTAVVLSFLGIVCFVTDTIRLLWLNLFCQSPPTLQEEESFQDGGCVCVCVCV